MFDRTRVRFWIEQREGRIRWAYRDSRGILTVGVGFNMTRPDARARLTAVGANSDRVASQQEALTDPQIDALFDADLDEAVTSLRGVFPNFNSISDARQAVLID